MKYVSNSTSTSTCNSTVAVLYCTVLFFFFSFFVTFFLFFFFPCEFVVKKNPVNAGTEESASTGRKELGAVMNVLR